MLYFLLGSLIGNLIQGLLSLTRYSEMKANIEYLESRIPKHDAKGRFTKKA